MFPFWEHWSLKGLMEKVCIRRQ